MLFFFVTIAGQFSVLKQGSAPHNRLVAGTSAACLLRYTTELRRGECCMPPALWGGRSIHTLLGHLCYPVLRHATAAVAHHCLIVSFSLQGSEI